MKTLVKLVIIIGLVANLVGCSSKTTNVKVEYGNVEVDSINVK